VIDSCVGVGAFVPVLRTFWRVAAYCGGCSDFMGEVRDEEVFGFYFDRFDEWGFGDH